MGAPRIRNFRQATRVLSGAPVCWDYFTGPEGPRRGTIRDVSTRGLLLCSSHEIDERRWLRLILKHPHANLARVVLGRMVRQQAALDSWPDDQLTLFRQGIELIEELPLEWVRALGNDSLGVCACGSLVPMKKPAVPVGGADEICGLCHLKSVMLTSRP